jgi:hypothetical protein
VWYQVSDVDVEVQARMLGNIVEILLAFGEGQDTVVAAAVEAVVKVEERLGGTPPLKSQIN